MLSRLNNEVLRYGATAVLPQNLKREWLERLQQRAESYLDSTYDLEDCLTPTDDADPILIACVLELYTDGARTDSKPSPAEIGEKLTFYCLSLFFESAAREYGLETPKPTVGDFFSWDRIRQVSESIPELTDFLEKTCMLEPPKTKWIETIREKLMSGIRGAGQSQTGG